MNDEEEYEIEEIIEEKENISDIIKQLMNNQNKPDPNSILDFKKKNPFDIIIAHGPSCPDGVVSAWIIWKLLPEIYRDKTLSKLGGKYYYLSSNSTSNQPTIYMDNDIKSSKKLTRMQNDDDNVVKKYPGTSIEKVIQLSKDKPTEYPVLFVFSQPQTYIPKELIENNKILILDLDVGMESMKTILKYCKSCVHIDHHKSSENIVKYGLEHYPNKYNAIFDTDITESGASLTWKYFHPNTPIPEFIQWIQIGDTWNWDQLEDVNVKAIMEAYRCKNIFNTFSSISKEYDETINIKTKEYNKKSLIEYGQKIIDIQSNMITTIVNNSIIYSVNVKDPITSIVTAMQCLVVNSNVLVSEVGNKQNDLANLYRDKLIEIKFCAVWNYSGKNDKIIVSLRSPYNNIDLSYIAKNIIGKGMISGGGHPNASGITIDGIANFHNIFHIIK